jgi:hypothetical protein
MSRVDHAPFAETGGSGAGRALIVWEGLIAYQQIIQFQELVLCDIYKNDGLKYE